MKFLWCLVFGAWCSNIATAQNSKPAVKPSTGSYSSDVGTVADAQDEAITQARATMEDTESPTARKALEMAVKEMERAKKDLVAAKNDPEKLPAAVAAEQAAYQALLKMIPHETRMSRSRSRGQGGGKPGQASREQMDQLEMTNEQNRYETERQATAPQSEQQREQLKMADRLKELAQRQQDMNERLKELQTQLAEAKTEKEREEAQRQLKRLTEEQRQMLADVDELKQQMEQSPNANSLSNARQQLDQVRNETQKAAQELENQSASQALAAGSRAEQDMQKLRSDLRNQTSSQFTEQMRQMRSQAREMSQREEEIGRGLDKLNDPDHKALDDSAPRKELAQQMEKQNSALTNLLNTMQTVSEQAETTEPLLSQQLYETLRRESQMHMDNIMDAEQELINRGLVAQAGAAERAAHTNIEELRQRVERAAESVLGNEADALRYAQKELDDLANRLQREFGQGGTNANGTNSFGNGRELADGSTNATARAGSGNGTNLQERLAQAGSGRNGAPNGTNNAGDNPQQGGNGREGQSQNSQQANSGRQRGKGQQGQGGQGDSSQQASDQQAGDNQANDNGQQRGNHGQNGRNGQGQGQGQSQGESDQQAGDNANNANGNDGGKGNLSDTDRLRQMVRQMGTDRNNNGARGGGSYGPAVANNGPGYGPVTGNDYVDWTSRMRDVESVLDEAALRNRLATARERLSTLRAEFRQSHIKPKSELVIHEILDPIAEVRTQLNEDLARLNNARSLVPLDHDPVPESYSELVRKYYEKLGDGR